MFDCHLKKNASGISFVLIFLGNDSALGHDFHIHLKRNTAINKQDRSLCSLKYQVWPVHHMTWLASLPHDAGCIAKLKHWTCFIRHFFHKSALHDRLVCPEATQLLKHTQRKITWTRLTTQTCYVGGSSVLPTVNNWPVPLPIYTHGKSIHIDSQHQTPHTIWQWGGEKLDNVETANWKDTLCGLATGIIYS